MRTSKSHLVATLAALAVSLPAAAFAQDPPADPTPTPVEPTAEAGGSADLTAGADASGTQGGGNAPAGNEDAGTSPLSDGRLPVPWVKRPLTLSKMTLAPALDFSVLNLDFGAGTATAFEINAGAQFGITEDIQVEAVPLSFRFGDVGSGYGAARIGGMYRFLKDDFEMAARLYVAFGDGFWGINAGAPMRLHIGDRLRLDTGVDLTVYDGGTDVGVGLARIGASVLTPEAGIPLDLSVQVIDQFWAGLGTGFGILNFEFAGDTIIVPLGVDLGATIPYSDGQSPMVDIGAGFSFPYFVNSGNPDTITPEVWQIGISARGYIYL